VITHRERGQAAGLDEDRHDAARGPGRGGDGAERQQVTSAHCIQQRVTHEVSVPLGPEVALRSGAGETGSRRGDVTVGEHAAGRQVAGGRDPAPGLLRARDNAGTNANADENQQDAGEEAAISPPWTAQPAQAG